MSLTSPDLDTIVATYRSHAAAAALAGDPCTAATWNLAADMLTDARFTAHHRATRRAAIRNPQSAIRNPKTPALRP